MLLRVVKNGSVIGALLIAAGCNPGGGEDTPEPQGGTGAPEVDAGPDAQPDGAACVEFAPPEGVDCAAPLDGVLPKDLRCTGLYGDFDRRELACGVLEYKPAHELWSDGAEKRRFVQIPEGQRVNAKDPDAFVYPDGTQFWKEFRVKGADGALRLAETRLLRKTPDGWVYTSYVWSEDERQAIQMQNDFGVPDLYATGHTVPNRDQCKECHSGRADFVLGWDALMLGSGAEGITREKLVELGLVEDGSQLALTIPGNDVERQALGYLHANCGVSCHNELPDAPARDTGLYLRLEANELGSVMMTDAARTGLNKRPAENAKYEGLTNPDPANWYDIRPGDPARSLLVARQQLRGFEGQMPRIATKVADDAGVQAVVRWIQGMTQDAGYPAPAP
ncbi:hypothetical protein [Sorangium sp. So ce131]|uniref:hypothetical protein n=1 Tax=Sorangium sp. So ce131 TaxID=3133282 RepID=UPI003F5E0D08